MNKLQESHQKKESDYQVLKKAKDSYDAAKKAVTGTKERLEPLDLDENMKRMAGEFLAKQKLHAARHTNSPEFNRMINALNIISAWPEIDKLWTGTLEEKPKSKEDALDYLKKQAEDYKKAKGRQRRIFKTELRKTRLSMADSIILCAEQIKKELELDNEAEREELNSYFDNGGKIKEDVHKEHTQNVSKETQKNEVSANSKEDTQKSEKDTKQIEDAEVENEFGRN